MPYIPTQGFIFNISLRGWQWDIFIRKAVISAFQTAGTAMTDNLIQIATPILTVIGVFVAAYGFLRNPLHVQGVLYVGDGCFLLAQIKRYGVI